MLDIQVVMFDCVRKLLAQTNTRAKDVDFLVINCSLFSPTPSLCSMVINEFGMRTDISSYNLSGMVVNIIAVFDNNSTDLGLFSWVNIY
jgi:3-ketoacyl-CoA synthase